MPNEMRTLLVAAATALAGLSCQSSSTQSDLQAINRLQDLVDAAIVAGDTEAYVALIADDAVLMPPNAPAVIGKGAIRAWNEEMSKQFRFESYKSVDDEVVVTGGWAFRRATAEWTLIPSAGGVPVTETGKFIIIYERQADGSWKVARDIWNTNTPAR